MKDSWTNLINMRNKNAINVTKTWLPDKEKYISYLDKIYETGWVTSYSPLVRELESKLATYLGVKNIVLVSSGTAALEVAYRLLDLKGEVITTPFSFVATTSSLVFNGLKPIFADIDSHTFCLDPANIEKLITPETSAIVPVHVFGNACQVEQIDAIAKENNLKVIYDAAHTFGVEYKGESILNYGDISTLSFQATKLFHTIEGGALIINDESLVAEARRIINFGINGEESIGSLGINAKMNEFEAAMGLCVLDDMPEIIEERKKIFNMYIDELKDLVTFQEQNKHSTQNYSYVPIVLKNEEEMKQIKERLNGENIFPRRYFYPSLDTLNYIEPKQYCPTSRDISSRILCLPIYPGLNKNDQKKIINIIKRTLTF